MSTGALYNEISYGKPFAYRCTCLAFDQANKKVKIRYIKPPAMIHTAIVKWVPYDQVIFYVYNN